MVRPANFGFNLETADNNSFQKNDRNWSAFEVQKKALKQFDEVVKKIQNAGIQVVVCKDSSLPKKPDAIFPNNWFSTHRDGTVVTYPMFSKLRRKERSKSIIRKISKKFGINKKVQLEAFEKVNLYLEGTGSMVLDRKNRIAYVCKSPRSNKLVLKQFCKCLNYKPVFFKAIDKKQQPIYHTNVMMSVGADFVFLCKHALKRKKDEKKLMSEFKKTGKEVIEISYKQMVSFGCNVLQVKDSKGKPVLLMSETAYRSLKRKQLRKLEPKTKILHCPIDVVEYYGGGSLRCMIAEIFLPNKLKS